MIVPGGQGVLLFCFEKERLLLYLLGLGGFGDYGEELWIPHSVPQRILLWASVSSLVKQFLLYRQAYVSGKRKDVVL